MKEFRSSFPENRHYQNYIKQVRSLNSLSFSSGSAIIVVICIPMDAVTTHSTKCRVEADLCDAMVRQEHLAGYHKIKYSLSFKGAILYSVSWS